MKLLKDITELRLMAALQVSNLHEYNLYVDTRDTETVRTAQPIIPKIGPKVISVFLSENSAINIADYTDIIKDRVTITRTTKPSVLAMILLRKEEEVLDSFKRLRRDDND